MEETFFKFSDHYHPKTPESFALWQIIACLGTYDRKGLPLLNKAIKLPHPAIAAMAKREIEKVENQSSLLNNIYRFFVGR